MLAADLSLRVLVVDDDDLVADYISLILEKLGCATSAASDGEAALKALKGSRFDVLITDWVMPKIDGIELVRRARAAVAHYLHVVLMTAPGEERTIGTALEVGADDFLYKPVTATQLEMRIAAARRVVELQKKLQRKNRSLVESTRKVKAAYRQLKSDLEAAGAMQRSLLTPDGRTGRIAHYSFLQPSIDIGGDSFGVLELRESTFFFVIDVSGHGVPAALNSFAIHQRVVQLAAAGETLGSIAKCLNRELLDQPGDSYATAFFGLTSAGNDISILRAGHPPPVMVGEAGGPRFLEDDGLPLGILESAQFESRRLELGEGNWLLCYSDGVMESGMDEQELLGFCSANARGKLAAIVGRLEAELARRRRGAAPADDISVLALAPAREE